MQFDETGQRIVMQPETEVEQSCLSRLCWVFQQQIGLEAAWFTLDLDQYDDLDHDLWQSAPFNPRRDRADVGARALVITHGEKPSEEEG